MPRHPGLVARRDAESNLQVGPTWESLVERQIREAQERGDFDDLPFRGERLPLDDDSYAGEMRLAFHVLRNAGATPPWIEADKEVRRLLAARDDLLDRAQRAGPLVRERYRRELARLVEQHNRAVEALNATAPTAAQQRRRLMAADELQALEACWSRTLPTG